MYGMREGRAAAIAGMIMVAASLITGLPERLQDLRASSRMLRVVRAHRYAAYFGAFWSGVEEAAQQFPRQETIPVVLRRPSDIDAAVFLTFYMYPRVTKYFWSLDQYRLEKQPVDVPIVYIDVNRSAAPRIVNYAIIRDEQLRDESPLLEPLPAGEISSFIVPIAAAFDGAPPDAYTTQLDLLPSVDASVTLVMEPSGATRTVSLDAGKRIVFRDVVYQQFGHLGSGWLRVETTAPVRAGAWLINRGRDRHVRLPLYTVFPPLPQQIEGGDRLWLLNAGDMAAAVTVNDVLATIPPRTLIAWPSQPQNRISGSAPVLAFSSTKLQDGNTNFHWPGAAP